MLKLSALKDFLGLITAAHTARPVIIVLSGAALAFLVAIPPAALLALGVVIVLAVALTIWQVTWHLRTAVPGR
jgi:hypothetical protein